MRKAGNLVTLYQMGQQHQAAGYLLQILTGVASAAPQKAVGGSIPLGMVLTRHSRRKPATDERTGSVEATLPSG